jgi:hypothetical protein
MVLAIIACVGFWAVLAVVLPVVDCGMVLAIVIWTAVGRSGGQKSNECENDVLHASKKEMQMLCV